MLLDLAVAYDLVDPDFLSHGAVVTNGITSIGHHGTKFLIFNLRLTSRHTDLHIVCLLLSPHFILRNGIVVALLFSNGSAIILDLRDHNGHGFPIVLRPANKCGRAFLLPSHAAGYGLLHLHGDSLGYVLADPL